MPKPVLIRLGDQVLTGLARGEEFTDIEWDWNRVVQNTEMKTQKDHYYLKRNWESFKPEFQAAQIPMDELKYKGQQVKSDAFQQHCMSSRALFLMVSLIVCNRRFAQDIKFKALSMLVSILKVVASSAVFVGTIFGHEGWHQQAVNFDNAGVTRDLEDLFRSHAGAVASWSKLMGTEFCGIKISSPLSHTNLWDMVVFLLWAKTNPTVKHVWHHAGRFLWPHVLLVCGQLLDRAAVLSLQKPIEAVPLMKTRAGHHKRTPFVNKWVLLQKMKESKKHRKHSMQTHKDIVPAGSHLVTHEQMMEVGLYMKNARKAFANACHLAISWDPSTYDVETLVSCLWSPQVKKAVFPPIQNLTPLVSSELAEELKELAAVNRLTRIDSYNELKALSHALAAFGWPLEKFMLGADLHWRPLSSSQSRVRIQGQIYIKDEESNTLLLQIPCAFDINKTPLLVSLSDQGSLNRAGLDYIVYKLGLPVLVEFDEHHRCWNDLRDALRKTHTLYKTFLSFALLFNINYGPSGSKAWMEKKKAKRQEFLDQKSSESNPFLHYLPYIQRERGLAEPTDAQGRFEVFSTISKLNNFNALGPVAKLMRWFSWYEAEKYFRGEVYMTKMLMMETLLPEEGVGFVKEASESQVHIPTDLGPKEELRKLKMQHGCFALAPMLVTPASMHQKDLIATLSAPLWLHFSKKAKYVRLVRKPGQMMVMWTSISTALTSASPHLSRPDGTMMRRPTSSPSARPQTGGAMRTAFWSETMFGEESLPTSRRPFPLTPPTYKQPPA